MPSSHRRLRWSELWLRDHNMAPSDHTLSLSDQTLTQILSLLPPSSLFPLSLTCKRWLRLSGLLTHSLSIIDFRFLRSSSLSRFPNLLHVSTLPASLPRVTNSGILASHRLLSLSLDPITFGTSSFLSPQDLLGLESVDCVLRVLSQACPDLKKLVLINASEKGLGFLAEGCEALQELELHCCGDVALKGVSGCRNLQILKIVGFVEGFYETVVSDIGLTNVARGCRRLVRLELFGCEGSYDGIKAIGQCCQMLEEITFSNHRMDGGWLGALSFCSNLKTLKMVSCKNVDLSPGPDEHLGACVALEELHMKRCQMRDKMGVRALFLVCEAVRELVFEDCWGLDDNILQIASVCRRVRLLSLEGCSLLTMVGLDALVLSWTELNRLRVISCNNIKDSEITPALASLFSVLKELKWRPDSRSLLAEGLAETGMGMKKGGRPFKRV